MCCVLSLHVDESSVEISVRMVLRTKAFFFFLKILFIYFDRERDSQREREHKQGEWERKKQPPSGGA